MSELQKLRADLQRIIDDPPHPDEPIWLFGNKLLDLARLMIRIADHNLNDTKKRPQNEV